MAEIEAAAVDEEEGNYGWYAYEDGRTVGGRGPEGGVVLRDEELGDPDDPEYADARLILERLAGGEGPHAYAVTAVLYGGWLGHTVRYAEENVAVSAFDAMGDELEALSDLIPEETDRDIAGGVQTLNQAIAAFVTRFS